MSGRPSGVACIVTWFHPPSSARDRLHKLREQFDVLIVVDNTPGPAVPLHDATDIVYLTRGRNLGLAAALNLALMAVPSTCGQVLFMDQDSELPAGAVDKLARHLQGHDDIAVAAPLPWDARAARAVDPTARAGRVRRPDVVITSGMLARCDALREVGPFREDFFIDGVDQDMCLRLRARGWRIVQDTSVLLPHELGSLQWRGMGRLSMRTTNHPAWRLYGAARNSAVLLREHGRERPLWAVRHVLQLLYWLSAVVLWEPPRSRRAMRLVQGVRDGWRGLQCDWELVAAAPGSGQPPDGTTASS